MIRSDLNASSDAAGPGRPSGANRHGFTLIELTAVVILLALIAGTTTVMFREPYRLANRQGTIDRLTFIDQHLRRRATRDAGQLVLNLKSGNATWVTGEDKTVAQTELASGMCIDRIWKLAGGENRKDEARIRFHSNGTADTYAVRTSVDGSSVRWLLFVGLTGQLMEIGNDREAKEVLRTLDANRADIN